MHPSMAWLVCVCEDYKGTKVLLIDDVNRSWEHNVKLEDILQFKTFLATIFYKVQDRRYNTRKASMLRRTFFFIYIYTCIACFSRVRIYKFIYLKHTHMHTQG